MCSRLVLIIEIYYFVNEPLTLNKYLLNRHNTIYSIKQYKLIGKFHPSNILISNPMNSLESIVETEIKPPFRSGSPSIKNSKKLYFRKNIGNA